MRRTALLSLSVLCLALPCSLAACAPRGVDVVMHDALAAQHEGDVDTAIARYRRALKIEPRVRGAYNNLAIIALAKGNLTQAVKLLEEELALHPRSPEANRNMAIVLLRLGRPDDAIARVAPLAAISGGAPTSRADRRAEQDEARLVLAVARWKGGQSAELVRQPLELVLGPPPPGADPEARAALERRAQLTLAYRAIEDGDEATALHISDAVGGPDAPAPLRHLRVIEALRDRDSVAALTALDSMPESQETLVLRASALAQAGRWDEAAALLGPAEPADLAALSPPFAVVLYRVRASLAAARGDWRGALGDLQKADEQAGGRDPDITLDRAIALAHTGESDAARSLIDAVMRDAPSNTRASTLAAALR